MKKLTLLLLLVLAASLSMQAAVITEQPEGTIFSFTRTAQGSFIQPFDGSYFEMQTQSGGQLEIVFNDADQSATKCYIKNIITGSETVFGDYWVEGDVNYISPGHIIITVPLGQHVAENRGRNAVLSWGSASFNTQTFQYQFTNNPGMTAVTYAIDGNTIHIEGTSGPLAVDAGEDMTLNSTGPCIVWEDEENPGDVEWTCFMEWSTEAIDNINPNVIVDQPAGTVRYYTRTSQSVYFKSSGAPMNTESTTMENVMIVTADDNKTVYIKDPLYNTQYGTWIQGTLSDDGTTITVPMPQALRITYGDFYYDLNVMGWGHSVYDESYDYGFATFVDEDKTQITYSIDGNTITLLETEGDITTEQYPDEYIASGLYTRDVGDIYIETNVVYTLSQDNPPVEPTEKTAAPTFRGYTGENRALAYFMDIIPTEPSTIHYRVLYPDGVWSNWAEYEETLAFTTTGNYSIEAYAVATGKLPSDVVSTDFALDPATGVSELNAGKTVTAVRYFNAIGQQVQQPQGLTIQVTTYSDGTSSAVKVIK